MKNSPHKFHGNKMKQINSLRTKGPVKHDDPMRNQPPTPQDIQRVQPVSQKFHKGQIGKTRGPKSNKGS